MEHLVIASIVNKCKQTINLCKLFITIHIKSVYYIVIYHFNCKHQIGHILKDPIKMIQCHCQSNLFYFAYRFFSNCIEYGNALFIISFDNRFIYYICNIYFNHQNDYFLNFSLSFNLMKSPN